MILLYILYLFSETLFLFNSTEFILTSFFFYISFFKAIDKFTTNVFLALGSTDLSFPTQLEIFYFIVCQLILAYILDTLKMMAEFFLNIPGKVDIFI